ncbi:hypothetical protein SCALM49S_02108 [Streptomyces californicus]
MTRAERRFRNPVSQGRPRVCRAERGDGGFGLPAMRARAGSLGGALSVESAPGQGTAVAVTLPLPVAEAGTGTGTGGGTGANVDTEAGRAA